MIGMIIVQSMCQHQVGSIRTNLANNPAANFQCRLQATVGVLPDFILGSDQSGDRFGFLFANRSQFLRISLMMSRSAIRHGNDFDVIAAIQVDRDQSARVKRGVVRVSAKD